MKWHHLLAVALLAQPLVLAGAKAQQAAGGAGQQGAGQGQGQARAQFSVGEPVGDEHDFPAGIAIGKSKIGPIFVDAKGHTLYQPSLRYLQYRAIGFVGRGGDPLKFCDETCAATWAAVPAPADAKPTGYWKVIEGASGPQWAYKNSPVFTLVADKGPGDLTGDGADETPSGQSMPQVWKAIAFIPPVPKITAPGNVAPLFAGGDYMLADKQGHALYSSSGKCGDACAAWTPFYAGLAAQSVGEWSVVREGDRPQWAFKGKLVYASETKQAANVPLGEDLVPDRGTILRP